MELVRATVWLYEISVTRAFKLIRNNWGVIFAPLAYSVILSLATAFLAPLGFVGGMLLLLVTDACISSGLYLIENLLKMGKADTNDFMRGWTVYIWEIIQVSFILWIPMTLASRILYPLPNGVLLLLFIRIFVYIVFNVVPELIYQPRLSGLQLLSASYNFVIENWIEWFIPNLLILFGGYLLLNPLLLVASSLPLALQLFAVYTGVSLFLAYFMIFRGILFSLLQGTSRRGRLYKYRVGEPFQGNPW